MTIQSDLLWKPPTRETLDLLGGKVPIRSEIRAALEAQSPVVISLSGGKDSDAMLYCLDHLLRTKFNYPGQAVRLLHCHLGRTEWPQTLAHVQSRARATFGE